jgi:hypothetical protein
MPPAGFEPAILAGEHPQNHALDRTVTAIIALTHKVHILSRIAVLN